MAKKSLDSEVLAALHLMSKDKINGIKHIRFVNQNITTNTLDLLTNRGYATKIIIEKTNNNICFSTKYCLTRKGIAYFDKILAYAQKQF